ncbi:MAG: TlyA family RNA methyltransferase [bacterium JZ-2024 1]
MRKRADEILVQRGVFSSRQQAQRAIKEKKILIDGKFVKPGSLIDVFSSIKVLEPVKYVSRGGEKLEAALKDLNLTVQEKTILDGGCSTGGFTDCCLQLGAKKVIAVDVGKGVLDWKLRKNPRVETWEGINLRSPPVELIQKWHGKVDIVLLDLSFISLCLIFSSIIPFLSPSGIVLALVKPQFELPPGEVGKGGVVRDALLRRKAVEKVISCATRKGLFPAQIAPCRIPGAKGNREYFVLFQQVFSEFSLPEKEFFE